MLVLVTVLQPNTNNKITPQLCYNHNKIIPQTYYDYTKNMTSYTHIPLIVQPRKIPNSKNRFSLIPR